MDLSLLNDSQKSAVTNVNTHVRIIAGAGSGKTRVVTQRIVYLVNEMNVNPSSILAITFTNKAANEMKERISEDLDLNNNRILVCTIHSLCVRILRANIDAIGYPKNFTILDSDDQKVILKEAYKKYSIDVKELSYNRAINYICARKNSSAIVDEFDNKELVNKYYVNRLKEMYALDFDDLLLVTLDIFNRYEHVRERWSNRFEYIHVDEFQDIDNVQYEIIKHLCNKHSKVCVVGDPDQTIYTWRGADVKIIIDFEKDFKGTKTIVLNQNYRSSKNILKAANSIIKNNKMRIDKDLFTDIESDIKIQHYSCSSSEIELTWVIQKIKDIYKNEGTYHNTAILYRSNFLSRNIEKQLYQNRIPYIVYGGIRFYERKEVKDALAYLKMITDDTLSHDIAFKRIINTPKRGIGNATLDKIETIARANNISMYEAIRKFQIANGKIQRSLDEFIELIQSYRKQREELSIERILKGLMNDSKIIKGFEDENDVDRIENVKALLDDIAIYEESDLEASIDEYLQNISLMTNKSEENLSNCITLMTVHSSKGLEFNNVFVYSMSENIFPNARSIQEAGYAALEEERRLAYVAFTRAKKQLFLSDSNDIDFFTNQIKTTSRFIKEIDDEVIDHINAKISDRYLTNDYTSRVTSKSSLNNMSLVNENKSVKYKKGDLIHHQIFGDGVILKVNKSIIEIAFEKKYGVKTLLSTHPAISKK